MPTARPVVRLTERLVVAGLTIKDDLEKAKESWQENFADPIKAALMAGPQAPAGEVTEKILGGVRIFLAKTFAKDSFDSARMAVALSREAGRTPGPRISMEDLRMLIDTQALVIAQPAAVAALLASRLGVNATSFVVHPENPTEPTRVDLRWAVLPDQAALSGPLRDLPDRVAVAAAGSNGGDRAVVAPAAGSALAAAEAIDRANAAGTPRTVAVRRTPRRQP